MKVILDHYNVRYSPTARRQKILCPVHGENRASCSLTLEDDNEFFRCFGCDAKGDVYDLVQGIEGVSFKAAADIIAGIPGAEGSPVRDTDEPRGRAVSDGSGYSPRYRRAVPARVRKRAVVD